MKNLGKTQEQIKKEVDAIHKYIQPALYEFSPQQKQTDEITESSLQSENNLNLSILKITMKIRDQYPDLSKYIEEMPVTIPDQKNPKVTLKNLKAYYDSLNSMLDKYVLEHPDGA